jgi:type I restriction-modification system DNA methylase subunit
VDRTHRELTDADIARIADTYHAWRGENERSEVSAQANPTSTVRRQRRRFCAAVAWRQYCLFIL